MIIFDEATHTYTDTETGKQLISVTQLLKKHGLAPNYDGIDEETLDKKAERGTLIHKEIEEYIKNGETGFTEECGLFIGYTETLNYNMLYSEELVHNDIVAGTLDLIIETPKEKIVADYKTTSQLHKEPISWQLSIYDYLKNGKHQNKLQAFWFNNGDLKTVDIPSKPVEEIEKLLDCERKGEIYQHIVNIDSKLLFQAKHFEECIQSFERQKKKAEAEYKAVKEQIIQAMKDNSITKAEIGNITLTYVAPTERASVDTAKLKADGIYDKYKKVSQVKEILRVKVNSDAE